MRVTADKVKFNYTVGSSFSIKIKKEREHGDDLSDEETELKVKYRYLKT